MYIYDISSLRFKEECSAVIPSFEHRLVSSLGGHILTRHSVIVEQNSESKLAWPTGDSSKRVVRLRVLSADTRYIESPTGL